MLKTRLLAAAAAFVVGFAPMVPAHAVITQLPATKNSNGQIVTTAGVVCLDTTGAYVGCGSGAGATPWTPDNGSLTTAAPNGTSSLSTAFSGAGTTVYVKNIGTVGVHFRSVLTAGTALLTDERLQPGMCGPIARGTGDRLALIADGATGGSVEITTGTGNPGFGPCVDLSAPAVTNPWAPLAKWGSAVTNLTSTVTATDCTGAPGAGITRHVAEITINDHAATDTIVQLLDADGTTVRWEGTAKANDQRGIVGQGPWKGAATAAAFKCKTLTSTGSGGVTFTLKFFDTP